MGGGAPVAAQAAPVTMRRSAIAQRSGAALMLALWALFLLSAMVIAWALDVDSRLTLSGNASRVVEAEAMASSGAEVALSPTVKAGLRCTVRVGRNQTYEARHHGWEGGRLNLELDSRPRKSAAPRDPAPISRGQRHRSERARSMMDCLLTR
jgi:hypothetical protein